MKKISINFLVLAVLIFSIMLSCNKEDDTWGDFTGNQDGEVFKTDPLARESFEDEELFHITASFYDQNNFIFKEISFLYLPKQEGKYSNLKKKASSSDVPINQCVPFYADFIDSDLLSATYHIGEGDTVSYIEIQCLKRRKVEGMFNITLVKDSLSRISYPSAKDTILLTNGYFNCKISDAN